MRRFMVCVPARGDEKGYTCDFPTMRSANDYALDVGSGVRGKEGRPYVVVLDDDGPMTDPRFDCVGCGEGFTVPWLEAGDVANHLLCPSCSGAVSATNTTKGVAS